MTLEERVVRIWPCENSEHSEIPLESNGVALQWNKKLASHLMVGEECGQIRLLDITSQSWLFSVYHPLASDSLTCIDWNQEDPNM